jgi:hypothetical protein
MKYALIVGIDKYKNKSNNLNGCVNDAHDVFKVLTGWGCKYQNITMLLNETATKANIIKNLTELVNNLKKGDVLTYYHSGHGTQILDKNNDETDGYDEALVTHDFNYSDAFTDDVLKECLSNHPEGANISLVFDTCHSGGFEMNSSDQTVRSVLLTETVNDTSNVTIKKLGVRQTNPHKQRHLLLSGCKEQQYSYEAKVGRQVRGLMTLSLCKIFRKNRGKDWQTIFSLLTNIITEQTHNRQQPQIIIPTHLIHNSGKKWIPRRKRAFR